MIRSVVVFMGRPLRITFFGLLILGQRSGREFSYDQKGAGVYGSPLRNRKTASAIPLLIYKRKCSSGNLLNERLETVSRNQAIFTIQNIIASYLLF